MHTIVNLVIPAVLALVLLIAFVTDVRKQKIYNWLTLPAIVLGLVLNGIASGGHGLLTSIEGIGVGSFWLILFIMRGGTGAGDVKLLQAVGALMGPRFMFNWIDLRDCLSGALLWTVLVGGVLGIAFAVRRRVLGYTVKNAVMGAHVLATVQSPDSLTSMADQSKAGKMPMAPAIALGTLIEWLILHHAA